MTMPESWQPPSSFAPPPPLSYAQPGAPTPPPVPPPKPRKQLWLIAVPVVLLVGVIGALIASKRSASQGYKETDDQRRKETLSAFASTAPADVSDPKVATGITRALWSFTAAAKRGDGGKMVACFDTDRLCDEIVATGLPGTAVFSSKRERTNLPTVLGPSLAANAQNFAWDGFTIRQIKPLSTEEVLVYLRVDIGDGYTGKFRAWLKRDGDEWRLYDYEDLSFGMRASAIVAAMTASANNSGSANQILAVIHAVRNGLQQLNNSDAAGALKTLRHVDGQTAAVPPRFEALRQALIGSALIQTGDHAGALKALEIAESHDSAQPLIHLLRGAAYNGVEEPEKALASIRIYEDAVGPEAMTFYQKGAAQMMLGESALAIDLFRQGLDDTPNSAECLEGLCRALGKPGLPEIRQRLALFPNKTEAIRTVGNSAITQSDADAVEIAISLFPDDKDPFKAYFQAEVHVLRKQWDQALPVFERNAARFSADPLLAEVAQSEHGTVLLRVGRVLDALPLVGKTGDSFVTGADELMRRGDLAQLEKLLATPGFQGVNEAIRLHYRGRLAIARKQSAEAEKLFSQALSIQHVDSWKTAHRAWLIYVLFHDNRHLDAYRNLKPRWDVYTSLVEHATDGEKPAVLRELADLAAKDFPDKPIVHWHRSTAAWMSNDYKSVVQILTANRAVLTAETSIAWGLRHRLATALIRDGRAADAVAFLKAERERKKDLAIDDLDVLAHAGAGNVAEAQRLMSQYLKDEELTLEDYLDEADDEMIKLLSSPPFAKWKAERLRAGPPTPGSPTPGPATTKPSTLPAATKPAATPATQRK